MTKIRSKIQFNPQRLEDARKTSGKKRSYRSIAEEIDVNERTIRKSCKDGLITPELLDKLARALNVDTAYLMGEFDLFYDQLNDEEIRRKYKEIPQKEYKIQDEINQHRNAANALWYIRESYVSLLTDYEILENDDIRHQRDVLCKKVSEVNNNYPATDNKSYRAAQQALKKDEEQTFKENEVDSLLPNGVG